MRFEKFCEIPEMYQKRRSRCMEDFRFLIINIEEDIRFQYFFNNKIANCFNKNYLEKYDKKHKYANKIAIGQGLFTRNIQLLYMMHESSLHGIVTSSNNLARTIYESILAQYYIGLYDDDMKQYLQECYPDYEESKKYNHNYFKQELYEENRLKEISKAYKTLSSFAHANSATFVDHKYEKDRVEDSLKFSLTLSLFNVLSYIQIYSYVPKMHEFIKNTAKSFINEIIVHRNYIIPTTLFPNHKKISRKLVYTESDIKKRIIL